MELWTTSDDARDADEDSTLVLPEAFNIIRPACSRDTRASSLTTLRDHNEVKKKSRRK